MASLASDPAAHSLSSTQLSCLSSSLPGEPSGQEGEWWSQVVARPCDIVSQRPIKASWAELRPEGNTGIQ